MAASAPASAAMDRLSLQPVRNHNAFLTGMVNGKHKKPGGKIQSKIDSLLELPVKDRKDAESDFTNLRQRHKLRATQDASCNETLGQMIQSHTDPSLPATEYPNLPAELRSADLNAMLPCYRTNADDFQRAFSPAH